MTRYDDLDLDQKTFGLIPPSDKVEGYNLIRGYRIKPTQIISIRDAHAKIVKNETLGMSKTNK